MALTPGQKNLQAECRGVASGHRAYADEDTGAIHVLSDTHGDIGKRYVVTFTATQHGPVIFRCAPSGPKAFEDDHYDQTGQPGVTPCLHAALAARRLKREGLIRFDYTTGLWTDAGKAPVVAEPSREVGASILARMGSTPQAR